MENIQFMISYYDDPMLHTVMMIKLFLTKYSSAAMIQAQSASLMYWSTFPGDLKLPVCDVMISG